MRAVPVALLVASLLVAPAARAEERIRVALETGAARVLLSAEALAVSPPPERVGERQEAPIDPRPVARGRVEVRAGDAPGELEVGGRRWPHAAAIFTAPGPIRVGERRLHPWVEVHRTRGGLAVVEVLPMEDYVAGVVSGETPVTFPAEARRAQAVAARTFALMRKLDAVAAGRRWDVAATVISQVFVGVGGADAGAREAAAETAGQVLTLQQELVETYFHSSCGGRTEAGLAALGRGYEYLSPVECGRCDGAPGALWREVISGAELGKAARLGRPATAVRVVERTGTGRAARVEIAAGDRRAVLVGSDLRQRLGWSRLRSLGFDVEAVKGGFGFAGRGSGHGAGLCQWGAAGLAREGKGYREILAHYYPGTEITVMY